MRSRSPEHRRRLAEAHARRYVPPCPRERLVELYVDQRLAQREVAERLGISRKRVETAMRRLGIQPRPAIKHDQDGAQSATWKGAEAGYQAKHLRVAKLRGAPSRCERCGRDDPDRAYDWANLTGNYDDPSDYARVCRPCHRELDAASYPRDARGRFRPREVV